MRRAALLVAWLVVMLVGGAPQLSEAQESFGQFKGELSVAMLPDGRNVRVAAPFGYIDPNGKHWDVPVGTVATQASWPAALTRRFPPLAGRYSAAAVLHDYFSAQKKRGWLDTHNMAYYAMRASGIEERDAKLAWAYLYGMGPRWKDGAKTRGPTPDASASNYFDELAAWITRVDPTLTEIAEKVERAPGSTPQNTIELRSERRRRSAWLSGGTLHDPCSEQCTSVAVFFGTDRQRQDLTDRIGFGAQRAERLLLGQAIVTVPKIERTPGSIQEPTWFERHILKVPAGGNPSKHFTIELLPVPRTLGLGVMMGLEVADGTTQLQPGVQARGGSVGAGAWGVGCASGA